MKKKDKKPTVPIVPAVATTAPAWKSVVAWGIVAWIVFVAVKFDQKFYGSLEPMFQFLEQITDVAVGPFLKAAVGYLQSIALFALVLTAVLSWGNLSLPRAVKESSPFGATAVLSFLIGAIEGSLLIVAVGFLGLLRAPLLFAGLTALAVGGAILARSSWATARDGIARLRFFDVIDSPAKWFLLLLCALAFLMSFVPELFYDSLVYHLGLPQMYVNEGRILDTPNVYFSRAPMLLHMFYVLAVALDGSTLAKLINVSFLLAGVGAAFVLCDMLGWKKTGVWAALFIISMPVLQLNVWSTTVDAAMGGFTLAALYCLLRWYDNPEHPPVWAVLAGLFCGGVFALKYPGVLVGVLMTMVLIVLCVIKRLPVKMLLLNVVLFGASITVVVAPWLVRNFVWTGNPVYPIASGVFESRHLNKAKMEKEENATRTSRPQSFKDFIVYPWKMTMFEISNFNFIGPLMLGLLPLLVLLRFQSPLVRVTTCVAFGYFLLELQFLGQLRYLMAGFFMLSVLAAGGLMELESLPYYPGFFVKAAILGVVFYHVGWLLQCVQAMYKPVPVLLGKQDRMEYASATHDGLNMLPWNPMYATLKNLPNTARVYIFANEQVFGFPAHFWYSSVHDDSPLVMWANESKTGEELYQKMTSQGFTHLLINLPEAVRLKGYNLFPWTDAGRQSFLEFADRYLAIADVKQIDKFPNALFLFELKDSVPPERHMGNFKEYMGAILQLVPES